MRFALSGRAGARQSVAALIGAISFLLGLHPVAAADDILDGPTVARERQHAPPRAAEPTASIDDTDAVAALDGIRIALTEVADGGTYVWHRRDGRLSGMAQPMSSYRAPSGEPCRRIVVMLNTFSHSSKVEGVACRSADGRWQLTG